MQAIALYTQIYSVLKVTDDGIMLLAITQRARDEQLEEFPCQTSLLNKIIS